MTSEGTVKSRLDIVKQKIRQKKSTDDLLFECTKDGLDMLADVLKAHAPSEPESADEYESE